MRITADRPLVLGSASPRRRELLASLGLALDVQPAHADETRRDGEGFGGYLERVTQAKLDAVWLAGRARGGGILVADTIVVALDGGVLGKPADAAGAYAMLERLAGATHEVHTRFLLAERGGADAGARAARVAHAETVTTRVTFRALGADEMRAYAATGEGRDKAGGYAIQGGAAAFTHRIDGSYTNVVGLPLSHVVAAMRALGWL